MNFKGILVKEGSSAKPPGREEERDSLSETDEEGSAQTAGTKEAQDKNERVQGL